MPTLKFKKKKNSGISILPRNITVKFWKWLPLESKKWGGRCLGTVVSSTISEEQFDSLKSVSIEFWLKNNYLNLRMNVTTQYVIKNLLYMYLRAL